MASFTLNSTVIGYAIGLFLLCLTVHVLLWRTRRIRRQELLLMAILVVVPIPLFMTQLAFKSWSTHHAYEPLWSTWILAYVLHLSLSVSYFFLYTAAVGVSPSIAILQRVAENMPRGLKRSEIAPPWFTDENLLGTRCSNLVKERLVSEARGLLTLSWRGQLIVQTFLVFRRALGLPDVAKG